MKWFPGLLVLLMAGTLNSQPSQATLKYGVVDVQEVLDQVEEGRKAIADFKKEFEVQKQKLEDQQKNYKKLEDDFEKQKLILAPAALDQRQKELEAKRGDLQRSMMDANTTMKKREMELSAGIIKKIRSVTEKIGQQKGYDIIYEKNEAGLLYYKDASDITKEVVAEYNKAYGKK